MLSSILRGQVEDVTGWAYYEMDNAEQATVHLKRAVSVLPTGSAWWRASNWRLGNALALSGKDNEALDAYIKTYKAGPPDPVRYSAIESLYKRLKGSTDGLEARIGRNPASPISNEVAVSSTPVPEPTPKGFDRFFDTRSEIRSSGGSTGGNRLTGRDRTEPVTHPGTNCRIVETTPEPSPASVATAFYRTFSGSHNKAAGSSANRDACRRSHVQASTPQPTETASPEPIAAATVKVTMTGPSPYATPPAFADRFQWKKGIVSTVIITIPAPGTAKAMPPEGASKPGEAAGSATETSPSPAPPDEVPSPPASPSPSHRRAGNCGRNKDDQEAMTVCLPMDGCGLSRVNRVPSPI
jgi:hypothetical protein